MSQSSSHNAHALKRMLLLGVAAGALLAALANGAIAGCTQSGKSVTCSGNDATILDGINGNDFSDPVTSLIVRDVTADITPPGGKDGVFVHTDSEPRLDVNLTIPFNSTGPHIETQGAQADGIDAAVTNGGTLDITSDAWIITNGANAYGIRAHSFTAGNITILDKGKIDTRGDAAHGIHAYAYANGSNIDITSRISPGPPEMIRTEGAGAHGIFAHSDTAGAITIDNDVPILTSGDDSVGILARSESGGDITITNSQDIQTQGKNATGIKVHTNRGDVHITNVHAIETHGAGAHAIQVESDSATGQIIIEHNPSANVLEIRTQGDDAHGIYARSNHKASIQITTSRHLFTEGRNSHAIVTSSPEGASVSITNKGEIFPGEDADAIRAEGTDFDITITNETGSKIFAGPGPGGRASEISAAIHIIDNGTGGTRTIINKGAIYGGGYGDAAIRSASGSNIIDNTGTIDGPIYLGWGDDTINNAGFIRDDVNLGDGRNAFNNLAGGTFTPFNAIFLGSGNTFTNEGVLSPWVNGTGRLTIEGNFEQKAGGKTYIDIDTTLATPVDELNISGSAKLAGKIIPRVVTLNGRQTRFLIIDAAGGVTDNGLQVENPAGYDFGLEFTDTRVFLTLMAQPANQSILDMLGDGGTADERAFARHLDAAHEAGGGTSVDALFDALRQEPDASALAAALNRLIPNGILARVEDTLHADAAFGNALLSCRVRNGAYVFTREGRCSWVRLSYRRIDRRKANRDPGMDGNAAGLAGGVQLPLSGDWRLGFALGYERTDADYSDRSQKLGKTKGDRLLIGAVAKNQIGPLNLYASLVGNFAHYANRRYVNIAGVANTARSHQNTASATARVRLSWLREEMGHYIRPMIDLSATRLHLGGYSEKGAGAANLNVHKKNLWVFAAAPAVEIGGQFDTANGLLVRPWLRAGVNLYSRGHLTTTATLQGAPAGVAPFTTEHRFGKFFADVQAGIYVLSADRLQLKLSYEGRFSGKIAQHMAALKLGLLF